MDRKQTFLKTLDKVHLLLKRLKEQEVLVRWLYHAGDLKEAYGQSLQLETFAEKLVLLTRSLPAYTGGPRAMGDVEIVMAECIPVEIGFTAQNWFLVRLPGLLPKKSAGSAEYIRSFLYPAMRSFFAGKEPVRYQDCVLIYRHVYDEKWSERRYRDHDNIEINMVSDIIALYVMPDDGPFVCSHYYCSAAGSHDLTEVYVVPKVEFVQWLMLEKTMPKEGVRLFENRSG